MDPATNMAGWPLLRALVPHAENVAVLFPAVARPATLGRRDEALPLQQRALQITETALGIDHPDMAIRLGNLAATYRALGQADKAVPLEERARQIRRERSSQSGGPE